MTTLNSDCQLPTEPINVKLPPTTPAKVEVFEEVPLSKLSKLSATPNRKKLKGVMLGIFC